MSLAYNGTAVQGVTYNGAEVQQITYNGTEIWSAQQPIGIVLVEKGGGSGIWGTLEGDTVSYRANQIPNGTYNGYLMQGSYFPTIWSGDIYVTTGKIDIGKVGSISSGASTGGKAEGRLYMQYADGSVSWVNDVDNGAAINAHPYNIEGEMIVTLYASNGTQIYWAHHYTKLDVQSANDGGKTRTSWGEFYTLGDKNSISVKFSWDFENHTMSLWNGKTKTTETRPLNMEWTPGMYISVVTRADYKRDASNGRYYWKEFPMSAKLSPNP